MTHSTPVLCCQATGEAIPLVVRSCIRAINLYGMHHEGLFRVSGLQAEINDIRASFEKGIAVIFRLDCCLSKYRALSAVCADNVE